MRQLSAWHAGRQFRQHLWLLNSVRSRGAKAWYGTWVELTLSSIVNRAFGWEGFSRRRLLCVAPEPHYLLAQVYRKLKNPEASTQELAEFEKLSKSRNDKPQYHDALEERK